MVYFPKLAQNHTHHQIFSIFWIFSTQIFDTHPYFFHFFPIFIRNLRTPPNSFPVIRLTLVKYITVRLLSIPLQLHVLVVVQGLQMWCICLKHL